MEFIEKLGVSKKNIGTSTGTDFLGTESDPSLESITPIDGSAIGQVTQTTREQYDQVIETAQQAFREWRMMPGPDRGEIVRQIGLELRAHKDELGKLVTYEMGKIYQEGLGEVQEMIDICDFAVGQSRMLYGKTMTSERPLHRLYEQWQPLGPVGIITAFNFPVAVWSWNAMIAAVCGDVMIWKPSEKVPLCSVAVQHIVGKVLKRNSLPEGIFNLINGGREVGEWMAEDERIPLISATGSVQMGRAVSQTVAARMGKTILELSGNNAVIVTQHADLEMAARSTVFGSVGTCGQRCTTTRRLFVHEEVFEPLRKRLVELYEQVNIGNPLEEETLVGPIIDGQAASGMQAALQQVQENGGELVCGGQVLDDPAFGNGHYVTPAIAVAENNWDIVQEETFAPILYLIKYTDLDEAIEMQNAVSMGLSSAIFTLNMREAERFLSARGSDCGIANVNTGTSGAEIGGAFGGEKDTGGGRESGSDAWKAYMRRQTVTINWNDELPLAQGIEFDID